MSGGECTGAEIPTQTEGTAKTQGCDSEHLGISLVLQLTVPNGKKSNRNKKPTIDEQAEIDALSTALVKGWFALGWLLRDRLPRDIFIDYEVERVVAGEPSGATFYAQQKGHRTVKFADGLASQRFDTKDLRYYAQKQDRPVFVLMVDITAKTGYFLFLQEWIDNHVAGGVLDQQETLTIKVPVTNRIDDGPALPHTVARAIQYMREKYPGSVAAAMRHDVNSVVARDPRFDVRLDVIGSHKKYHLTPKVPVQMKIKVVGEKAGHFRELFEYGRPIDVTGEGVSVEGLPIIHESQQAVLARLAFKPADAKECDFEFWLDGPGDDFRVRLDGEITRGTAGLLYRGRLKGAPLNVEIKIPIDLLSNTGKATINLIWEFSVWEGKCILDLPYFEALAAFAKATMSRRKINHRFSFQGIRLTHGTLGAPSDSAPFDHVNAAFSLISKASELARAFNVRPVLPKINEIKETDEAAINFAYAVAIEGGHRLTRTGIGMEIRITAPKGATLAPADQGEGSFRVIDSHHDAKIFGTPIDIGPVEITLTPAKLVVADEIRAKMTAGTTETVPIEVIGVGEATISFRHLTPAEFEAANVRAPT